MPDPQKGLEAIAGVQWPGVIRHVVTTGKFDTRRLATACNIEVGYPAETAWLATLASWGAPTDAVRMQHDNALNLFALRKIWAGGVTFDFGVIVQDGTPLPERWADVHKCLGGKCVASFGRSERPTIVFDMKHKLTEHMLEIACDLFTSGAVFALEPYSVVEAFAVAELAAIIAGQAADYAP